MQAGGEEEEPAAALSPGAGKGRQAADGAERHPTVGAVLHADQGPDEGRGAGGVGASQPHDLLRRQPGQLGGTLRRIVPQALAEAVEPGRVALDVVRVM